MSLSEHKSLQPIPKFESEDEERGYWATHDSAEHINWSQAKQVTFSQLKPSASDLAPGSAREPGEESSGLPLPGTPRKTCTS